VKDTFVIHVVQIATVKRVARRCPLPLFLPAPLLSRQDGWEKGLFTAPLALAGRAVDQWEARAGGGEGGGRERGLFDDERKRAFLKSVARWLWPWSGNALPRSPLAAVFGNGRQRRRRRCGRLAGRAPAIPGGQQAHFAAAAADVE